MTQSAFIAVTALVVTIGGPLLLSLIGAIRNRRVKTCGANNPAWDSKLAVNSALLYALAFSLIFFIQELFLVVPKALTPGLRPKLLHNNHQWDGDNPLAALLQGTGALAIFAVAIAFAFWLKRHPPRSTGLRLFVIWMTYHGFFESVPQVVVGAILPQNDVGMAMDYLRLTPPAKSAAALIALAAIASIASGSLDRCLNSPYILGTSRPQDGGRVSYFGPPHCRRLSPFR